jgi:2-polyprenyl-6-hydroxyphenyl methylase/3-demethylubiquinone-9 3-methyltransferase
MKTIAYQNSWHDSWKYSYPYDLIEIYGENNRSGYSYAYANRRKYTLELIQKVAQPGAKILDVAAAQGNFSLSLAELGYQVTWNDFREELIDYVNLKKEFGDINYAPGNAFDLQFDSYFDVILIAEVIEHVAHPDRFLRKIAQMLKPGGHIVMSTPNGEYFKNHLPKFSDCPDPSRFESVQFQPNSDGHIFLLHLDEIQQIADRAGLVVAETLLLTNPLTNGHIKLHHLLKILPRTLVNAVEKLTCFLPLALRRKLQTCTVSLLVLPGQTF